MTKRESMRLEEFVNGEFYHIYNRGVDRQTIFRDREDYIVFLRSLYAYNNLQTMMGPKSRYCPLVSVLSYCLIPNHFHLALRQEHDQGISKYLHKVEMRYAKHFNAKYARTGRFFESAFNAQHVSSDAYLEHLPKYIHLNALDLTPHDWRNGTVLNWPNALNFLDQYPWSSHHVYKTRSEALPIINMKAVDEIFPSTEEYLASLKQWSQAEISFLSLSNLLVTT